MELARVSIRGDDKLQPGPKFYIYWVKSMSEQLSFKPTIRFPSTRSRNPRLKLLSRRNIVFLQLVCALVTPLSSSQFVRWRIAEIKQRQQKHCDSKLSVKFPSIVNWIVCNRKNANDDFWNESFCCYLIQFPLASATAPCQIVRICKAHTLLYVGR